MKASKKICIAVFISTSILSSCQTNNESSVSFAKGKITTPTPYTADQKKIEAANAPKPTPSVSVSPTLTLSPTPTPTQKKQPMPTPSPTLMPTPNITPSPKQQETEYPLHTNITATVFWVGEPQGNGSSEDNALSAWDDEWQKNFGGYDDPINRNGYFPKNFTPKENPFYLDLPYNDFNEDGDRKSNAFKVVPWANEKQWGQEESLIKNRWVKLTRNNITCYGQIEDAGPYEYDDVNYVFGNGAPKNTRANSAGLDVSPALRDCLKFNDWNNDENIVDWQFVDANNVPSGPWTKIITTSQINWPQ